MTERLLVELFGPLDPDVRRFAALVAELGLVYLVGVVLAARLLPLLYRNLFAELVRVFALGLAGMTGIFVFFGVVQTASQSGLSLSQTLTILPLVVPMSWPYTIPATTLFAACVVYGRVSNDNEAVALKAAGVDLLTVLRPALLLGLLNAGLTAGLLHTVVPLSLQMQEAAVLRDPEEVLYNLLKRNRDIRGKALDKPTYSLYVRDVQNRQLRDVVVKRMLPAVVDPDTGLPQVVYDFVARAPTATLRVDLERGKLVIDGNPWTMSDGKSYVENKDSPPVEMELPEQFTGRDARVRPQAVTWDRLPAERDKLAAARDEWRGKWDAARREADAPATPPEVANGLRLQFPLYEANVKDRGRAVRGMEYERLARPALAAGCLIFAAIGGPVGLWFSRSDYLSTFVVCFLPSMLLYYSLTFAGGGLARDGKVPMPAGVLAADVLLGLVAVVLAWRLVKR